MSGRDQNDKKFMRRCLELSQKGRPQPNPYVGAVLVDGKGQIVAEGYHERVGREHAEAVCLQKLKAKSKKLKVAVSNLKLYINLEPCCHWGKTPPCVEAIIESGIKKVVVAMKDPNPKVNGQGIRELRQAGLDVKVGILSKEAWRLNEQFITYYTKKRSFVALKTAATLDGKIATRTGDSKWITGESARRYARGLRGRYQAILVGINTVLADDPRLGDSLRIILDSKLRIPLKARVLRDKNVVIATTSLAAKSKIGKMSRQGYRLWVCHSRRGQISLKHLLRQMYQNNVISVLAEGGGQVISSFLRQRLADKIYWFLAPKIIGDERALSAVKAQNITKVKDVFQLKEIVYRQVGKDILAAGYLF